jgi:hypothetical protein
MTVSIPLADRISHLPRAPISPLAQNAHMVLIVCLLAATLFRRYFLENLLPKIPVLDFAQLNSRNKKSFLNSFMHLLVRLAALFSVIPAFIIILAGKADFATTFTSNGPSFGTMLMAFMILMCSIYIHEIIYREHMTFITLVHHVGTVAVGAYSILFSLEWEKEDCTQAYFAVCCIFGFFDVITEFWITLSFVICTIYRESHRVRYLTCSWAAGLQTLGIIVELPLILVVFYSADMREIWPLEFEIVTPLLYFIFLTAQGSCVFQFYKMARKHRRQWIEEMNSASLDIEFSAMTSGESVAAEILKDEERNTTVKIRQKD